MYSHILAKMNNVDLRKVRGGNPGSSNLWRARGWKWGAIALGLDYFKGTFPLFLFIATGLLSNKYAISLAALAGVMGYAFSPMLRFRGGKAVATTFGAWSVLTKWEAPSILGGVFAFFSLLKRRTMAEEDAFRVFLGLVVLSIYVAYRTFQGQLYILLFYLGNFFVLSIKHWKDWRKFFSRSRRF
ncbi:hypothetical protein AS159_09400 [Thermotoga sp. Ku-13t]|nr:hypothetical protein AS159_09400 [Thermotoga sp. Ku-13t]